MAEISSKLGLYRYTIILRRQKLFRVENQLSVVIFYMFVDTVELRPIQAVFCGYGIQTFSAKSQHELWKALSSLSLSSGILGVYYFTSFLSWELVRKQFSGKPNQYAQLVADTNVGGLFFDIFSASSISLSGKLAVIPPGHKHLSLYLICLGSTFYHSYSRASYRF